MSLAGARGQKITHNSNVSDIGAADIEANVGRTQGGVMITAVFFTSPSFLDSHETRLSMLRIPEIVHRLRVSQDILEQSKLMSVDLLSYLGSDDQGFLQNNNLKILVAAIVQLGLYDRFLKNSFFPHYLIGNCKGDSALNVVAGVISFEEMIEQSPAVQPAPVIPITSTGGLPILTGTALAEYTTYQSQMMPSGDIRFSCVSMASLHLRDISRYLLAERGVERWVNIGPTPVQFSRDWKSWNTVKPDVSCTSSIELDPMLSWFGSPLMLPVQAAH